MRFILIAIITLLISSCALFTPYQPDTQQGNIITADMVSQLQLGMSPTQVQQVMGGSPVLHDVFADNTMTYVYTMRPSKKTTTEQKLVLTFQNNKLVTIQK